VGTVELRSRSAAGARATRKAAVLSPVLVALCYPLLLRCFHRAVAPAGRPTSAADTAVATACLLGALVAPLLGLAVTRS
jgi:hypothetical protein